MMMRSDDVEVRNHCKNNHLIDKLHTVSPVGQGSTSRGDHTIKFGELVVCAAAFVLR